MRCLQRPTQTICAPREPRGSPESKGSGLNGIKLTGCLGLATVKHCCGVSASVVDRPAKANCS